MRYKIKDIGEEGVEIDLPLTEAWIADNLIDFPGKLGDEGLRLKGRLQLLGDEYLLRGSFKGSIDLVCGRCLEPTTIKVDSDVAVQFVEKDPNLIHEDPEGGGDFVQFEGGVIDLTHEICEEIFLAIPMSPACDPPCAGMCPHCGRNREKDPCDCEEQRKAASSPFAALAKLKS